jgi:hypothetical protein
MAGSALTPRLRRKLKRIRVFGLPSAFHAFGSDSFSLSVTKLEGLESVGLAGVGKDEDGVVYFRLVVRRTRGKRVLVVRAGDLAAHPADVFSRLADLGAKVLTPSSKANLIAALEAHADDKPSFFVTTKPGWTPDLSAFVHPAGIIGPGDRSVEFAPAPKLVQYGAKFRVVGSARRWRRRVGKLLRGNSLGILAAAVALVPPVLVLLGEENFFFALVGGPGFGKSTVIVVATSQWGAHFDRDRAMSLGSAETAKNTLNNLDYLLLAHNDLGAAIDDLRGLRVHGSRAQAYEELALSAADGSERGRATVERQGRFRTVVLTSSNASLQREAVGGQYEADRAVLDRFVEVPLPLASSAFEELHGYSSVAKFAQELKGRALNDAGAVGLEFLRSLHGWVERDRAASVAWLEARVAWFIKRFGKLGAPDRVLRRFALIYAVGSLAIKWGLHPWSKKEFAQALATSLRGHVNLTVTNAPGGAAVLGEETARVLAILRDWFVEHRHRMVQAGANSGLIKGSGEERAAPGFLYTHHDRGGEVLLREHDFAQLVQSVCTADHAKALLAARGVIAVDETNKRRSFSVKRTVGVNADGGKWRPNMIALSRRALDPALAPPEPAQDAA